MSRTFNYTLSAALFPFLIGPNPRLQIVCNALPSFFEFTGRWDEWLSLEQQAETKAIASNDYYNAGWRARQAGWVHYLRQQADAVLACADRAANHWQTAQAGASERANAIRLRGIGYQLKNDYHSAIASYLESLDLWRSLSSESDDVAIALNSLAVAERLSGDLIEAERYYREALRIARKVGHSEGVATFTANLAELALQREDWPVAESLSHEALVLSEKVGRQQLIATNCYNLSGALVRQGKTKEALPYAQRAVEIFTQLDHPELVNACAVLTECEA